MADSQILLEVAKTSIGVVSFGVAFLSYRAQLDAKYYGDFSKRFAEVVETFPGDSWQRRFKSDYEAGVDGVALKKAAYAYLLLCSEEYFVASRRFLPLSGWAKWEPAIERNLRAPLFMQTVPKLEDPFEDYPEFAAYVRGIQAKGELKAQSDRRRPGTT